MEIDHFIRGKEPFLSFLVYKLPFCFFDCISYFFISSALPMNFAKYRLAIQLFKLYNGGYESDDWQDLNVQQNFNARCDTFHINDCSKMKVGKNILCNRLTCLNRQVKLDWLNLSLTAFKLKAKNIFLTN